MNDIDNAPNKILGWQYLNVATFLMMAAILLILVL